MEETRNLCVQIPIALHAKVRREQEQSGKILSRYIADLLTEYYEKKGKKMENTRTLAFQVTEELFQKIKEHLAAESARTGRKVSQREFILGLIEQALEQPEAETETAGQPEAEPENQPESETQEETASQPEYN